MNQMTPIRAGQVGRSIPRLEATSKVTGRVEYVHTMRLPRMLTAKLVRSTVANGRIKSIDIEVASKVPGVYRIVTSEDVLKIIPNPYYGPAFHDQPILAINTVHYVGEPVAAVLASDPHVAEEAARLVVVDYEDLPAVFDEVEAQKSKIVVHEELKPAGTFPDLKHLHGVRDTNVALDFQLKRGDADKAFAEAEHIFEHTFKTQQVLHVPLEPYVSIAETNGTSMTIHTASQSPSFVRLEIARLLGWPENRIRVRVPFLGGGFGGKLYIKLEALVAALSLIVLRPVKSSLTMEEQFYTLTKHASTFRIKSAVSKDGKVTGRECEVWWNGGAYADIGPRITQKSGFTAPGPYDIDNIKIDSYALYTNLPPAGALRGFGIPQLVWAYESHTDLIARALGMDPLEFRRKNILRDGRAQATGTIVKDMGAESCLERAAQLINWSAPLDRGKGTIKRGRGIAVGFKASISPTTSIAVVNVAADGSATLFCGTVDMGQGSDTAMAQLVAEVLNIPAEMVHVVHSDTDVTPYDMATLGSRSTFHMGLAVKRAAEDAKAKLEAMAQEVGLPPGSNVPIRELFERKYKMQAGTVVGTGDYIPPYTPPDHSNGQSENVTPFWMVGATAVEIEIDTETGHMRIEKMINVADVGRSINPQIVETQLSGAAIMQLGFTTTEKMEFEAGQVTNASFADYKIPGFEDLPESMTSVVVDANQHNGPFGAKGVGESGTFGVSPAIANAVEDAIGVRITSLPITPEKIYRAIRAAQNEPLED
ncbi:MAG TPA: xanthine dehydrogenase family protein molybdopterin-binding subunit [Pseudolabrys sp.]